MFCSSRDKTFRGKKKSKKEKKNITQKCPLPKEQQKQEQDFQVCSEVKKR